MKEKYSLVGVDGNAFVIMGYVRNAMKKCGFTEDQIKDYLKQATSSDYYNLIAVSQDIIEQCNEREK